MLKQLNKMKQLLLSLKYKFEWLRIYFSPFKPIKPKFYFGKIALGTPYFYPRVWKDNPEKPGYKIAVPKKFGFDIVGLGWKTKWSSTDYRHEYSPIWSFVFFGYQVALTFVPEHQNHYWECWLYYDRETKGKTKDRLQQAREEFPCVWSNITNDTEVKTCYWDLILSK